ncbi:MAG: AraC family transcriptional regulator [Salinivirgaceae bacterium]|nr:AraC family transcriptional regulator [Salinivirgaceae bacterium]
MKYYRNRHIFSLLLAFTALAFAGCFGNQPVGEPDDEVATARSYRELGLEYDTLLQERMAEYYYMKAFETYTDPSRDWDGYADVGYRYAYFMKLRGDLEGAVGVVTEVLRKAEGHDDFPHLWKAFLLCQIAEFQLDLGLPKEARGNYDKAYQEELKAVELKESGYFNAMVLCINIFYSYFNTKDYDEARNWLQRSEEMFHKYEQNGDTKHIEEYKCHFALYNALFLQTTGDAAAAAKSYASADVSNLRSSWDKTEITDYLMAAGRYAEAADVYAQIDSDFGTTEGTRMTFDNISERLVPRYYANRKAGRTAEALRLADKICDNIDSALVWNKNSDAAELAIIYQTHENELALQKSRAETRIHRIFLVAALLLIVLIAFMLAHTYAYNKVLSTKNRTLYQKIKQLEQAEAEEQSQMQKQPIETLSHNQQLYQRLCELMKQSDIYTDPDTNHETLARLLGTNYTYVYDALRECAHQTPADFINLHRLRHAALMLTTTDEPVGLVIEMSGITNRSTFNRLFREHYSMSPTEYRRAAKSE